MHWRLCRAWILLRQKHEEGLKAISGYQDLLLLWPSAASLATCWKQQRYLKGYTAAELQFWEFEWCQHKNFAVGPQLGTQITSVRWQIWNCSSEKNLALIVADEQFQKSVQIQCKCKQVLILCWALSSIANNLSFHKNLQFFTYSIFCLTLGHLPKSLLPAVSLIWRRKQSY